VKKPNKRRTDDAAYNRSLLSLYRFARADDGPASNTLLYTVSDRHFQKDSNLSWYYAGEHSQQFDFVLRISYCLTSTCTRTLVVRIILPPWRLTLKLRKNDTGQRERGFLNNTNRVAFDNECTDVSFRFIVKNIALVSRRGRTERPGARDIGVRTGFRTIVVRQNKTVAQMSTLLNI